MSIKNELRINISDSYSSSDKCLDQVSQHQRPDLGFNNQQGGVGAGGPELSFPLLQRKSLVLETKAN